MREHPDRETLKQFISGKLASEDARWTDRHLAACPECRDRAYEISDRLALQLLDSWLRPSYDEAFERAADKAADRLAVVLEDSRSVEDLFKQLMRGTAAEHRNRIAAEEKFQTIKLCQFFRSRSREAWFSDPAAALKLADLAVEVAQHLSVGRYGSTLVEDARALAWGYLGNSFRVKSDLWRAEQALRQAWIHHAQAGEDALTETELLGFTASLRKVQGFYDEAERLSDQEIAIYQAGEDSRLEGVALIRKGGALCYQHRYMKAISVTQKGLQRIDPNEDARLFLIGRHNLLWALSHSGAPIQANRLLEQSSFLYSGRIDLARRWWLEGLIARDLGHFTQARKKLDEVREFFLECNLGVEVFVASVHLAEIYTRYRKRRQVKEILGEIIPLGEALGLRKDVLQARLLYEHAS